MSADSPAEPGEQLEIPGLAPSGGPRLQSEHPCCPGSSKATSHNTDACSQRSSEAHINRAPRPRSQSLGGKESEAELMSPQRWAVVLAGLSYWSPSLVLRL